jgi:hypothetical protein
MREKIVSRGLILLICKRLSIPVLPAGKDSGGAGLVINFSALVNKVAA